MVVVSSPPRTRIDSVDILRGVVMIVMALDHVRDYFGVGGNPTDPARATAQMFFTRWITHFCAPGFFLLTGTSAYLASARRSRPELSRLLLTRGAWLILIELTVLRCLGYQFNFDYRVTMLVVLWALGWAMISLGILVHASMAAIVVAGVALIVVHNLFDPVQAASLGSLGPLWLVLHSPGVAIASSRHLVFVSYPLVPWIGVTAVGFVLGQIYEWPAARRRTFLLRTGSALTLAFVVLRFINLYGDPVPWTIQHSRTSTLLSFLNATKYPPSLLFLLMTLGPAALLLWRFDGSAPRLLRPAHVVGQVPMFYFLLHLPLIHLLAVAVCYVRYGDAHWMFESPTLANYPFTRPPGWGFPLPAVYLVWALVVIALYPLCVWFAALKRRRTDWWLSYL